jgi:uncharacterized integral membrane protein
MISVMCACGKRLKTEDRHAGKRTRCPNCGADAVFPIPEPAAVGAVEREVGFVELDGFPTEAPPVPRAKPAPLDENPPPPTPAPRPSHRGQATPDDVRTWLAREPWYYGLLHATAGVVLGLASVVFILVCAAALWILRGRAGFDWVLGLFLLLYAVAGLLLVGFATGAIMLAVDAVRHLRHIRASTAISAMAAAPPDSHA